MGEINVKYEYTAQQVVNERLSRHIARMGNSIYGQSRYNAPPIVNNSLFGVEDHSGQRLISRRNDTSISMITFHRYEAFV